MNTKEKKLNYEAPFTEVQPLCGPMLLEVNTWDDGQGGSYGSEDDRDDDTRGAKELSGLDDGDVWQSWSQGNGCYNWDE